MLARNRFVRSVGICLLRLPLCRLLTCKMLDMSYVGDAEMA